ncbi:MAG: tetratricopeptide repeat protein [Abditibacteriales bacterium]|nr:tetratricopeptide repeat protein [Abditibacteriales bacterium]MDW8365800.1 tetratricopeptide repeat protein [Abditibacteriales bacterium]
MKIALLSIAAALGVNVVVIAVQSFLRPPKPPLSPVFVSAAAIRELQAMVAEFPHEAEWHWRLGQVYLQDGHFLSAIEAFEAALQRKAPESLVRRALVTCYSNLDRHEDALKQLERLIELEPNDLNLRLQMASEYAMLNRLQAARRVLDDIPRDAQGYPLLKDVGGKFAAMERVAFAYGALLDWHACLRLAQQVLRDAGNRTAAHVAAGQALMNLGRAAEAASHFQVALRAHPDNVDLQFMRAQALLQATPRERQREIEPEVQRLLESVAKSDSPLRGQASFALGQIYERQRAWGRAGDAFMAAYGVRTKPLLSLQRAARNLLRAGRREEGFFAQGLYYETLGRFAEALKAYGELTKMHSCCQSGYMHVARIRAAMRQPQAALALLKKALTLPDPPPKVYAEMAKTYSQLKDLKNEQAMWREFIKRDPQNADVGYQHLGALADSAGKLDEAEALYRKCVELQPNAEMYRIRLARTLLQRRSDPAKLQEAIAHLEKAVQIARDYPEGYFELGIAYRYARREQEAIWAIRHAIDLDPGNGKYYQPLGELLIAVGQRAEGERTLKMFRRYRAFYQAWETVRARATRAPHDVDAQRRLAQFYERAGASLDALQAYVRVLELQPNDARAQRKVVQLSRQLGQEAQDLGIAIKGGTQKADER